MGDSEKLLAGQPDNVMWEHVYAPSSMYDDYLRVGVELSMTPEQFSMEWGHNLLSPGVILLMSMIFLPIFGFAFVFFGIAIFRPALLPGTGVHSVLEHLRWRVLIQPHSHLPPPSAC